MLNNNLTRIGVFYDGSYFHHISNYYNYVHERKSRISIEGLHRFICNQVSQEINVDERLCHIVDAHYFRGRLSAVEAKEKGNALFYDRVFDDVLSSEGVTTHYLPLKSKQGGGKQEKGIDVWLALEAFEQAFYKRFNVLVLIAGDGDYLPLVRKLNALGTHVMVLSWDLEFMNDNNCSQNIRTSQDLLEEATYPISMHEIIDNRVKKNEPLINGLFLQKQGKSYSSSTTKGVRPTESTIHSLKAGYGFITHKSHPKGGIYFHSSEVDDDAFNELKVGDKVSYISGKNENGDEIAKKVSLIYN